MRRSSLLIGITLSALGCASSGAHGRMAGSADVEASTSSNEGAWSGSGSSAPPPATAAEGAPAPASTPALASSQPQPAPPPPPGCELVCNVANRGRMAQADEARFTSALAGATGALRSCIHGHMPSLTLRFDSAGTLTHFGVDAEDVAEGVSNDACVDTVRNQQPNLTFGGPATVRCGERCR